jgi:hypothetical protein
VLRTANSVLTLFLRSGGKYSVPHPTVQRFLLSCYLSQRQTRLAIDRIKNKTWSNPILKEQETEIQKTKLSYSESI